MLDPRVIREFYPRYPESHNQARQAFQAVRERKKETTPHWKNRYQKTYGVAVELETFQRVAARMADTNDRPPVLADIVHKVCAVVH
jgi:hypothetical protein